VFSRSNDRTIRSRAFSFGHRIEDRIEFETADRGEIHLRHQREMKAWPNTEKWDVGRRQAL